MFNSKKKRQQNLIIKADHYAGYILFIVSVSLYFYWSKNFALWLLEAGEGDNQIMLFIMALTVCWFGSVLLMAQRLRFYLKYAPGLKSYAASIVPLLIIPAVWALLQVFNLIEI